MQRHLQPWGRVAALGLYQAFCGALCDVVSCAERGEDGDDAEPARRLQCRVRLAERGAERCREHVVAGGCADDLLEEDADAHLVARRQPPTREVSQEAAVGHSRRCGRARRHRDVHLLALWLPAYPRVVEPNECGSQTSARGGNQGSTHWQHSL